MEKYDNIFWKVYRWFRWDWKHFHKYLYYGIKNLITWFPVIWKDRDWDDYYILEILKFKINKTANSFEKNKDLLGGKTKFVI